MKETKTTIQRREDGDSHHLKSVFLANELSIIDKCHGSDRMGIGPGDVNGEDFLYLLDIYFERRDKP